MTARMLSIGTVAIGRNEGSRLVRCLESASTSGMAIVYVDSGSTDGSVDAARRLGADVVELDMGKPFTAARARNAGFEHLLATLPELEMVQFVDGDCEIVQGWLDEAVAVLRANSKAAVVCGRRRELYPDVSVYNRLCDMEWDTPIGVTQACGGDALMRVEAFRQLGGYDPSLIAGEEPELCVRLREHGWEIWRIDAEMTRHDAAITRFAQWWRRNVRAGHAFAEVHAMHGQSPEHFWARETRSGLVWGFGVPLLIIVALLPTRGVSLGLVLLYGVQVHRVYRYVRRRRYERAPSLTYALFCVLGKVPEAMGQLKYWTNRWLSRRSSLIEYKSGS